MWHNNKKEVTVAFPWQNFLIFISLSTAKIPHAKWLC